MLLLVIASVTMATPNTCQPRAAHPFLPIYHIIGNVTTSESGIVTSVEDINDVSSVILYKGIYHVFHQCCQNHWDHVVSKDLIHWTRLPPPITPNMNPTGVPHPDWYDAHGSWDGSLSVPHTWNGITAPVVVMTGIEGAKPHSPPPRPYTVAMAVVRPTNLHDPYLLNWTKDANNPIRFESGAPTTPYDTPGQVWKNGDHYNLLILGQRYTTKDPSLHTWSVAPTKFANFGEQGGQWFSPLANLADGTPPPANAPGWMMNVGGGNVYALGDYDRENETWTTVNKGATIDHGPDAAWMAGQFAGERFMNIGWMKQGPPMQAPMMAARRRQWIRHEPWTEFMAEAVHVPAHAQTGCSFTQRWQIFPEVTNIYNREPCVKRFQPSPRPSRLFLPSLVLSSTHVVTRRACVCQVAHQRDARHAQIHRNLRYRHSLLCRRQHVHRRPFPLIHIQRRDGARAVWQALLGRHVIHMARARRCQGAGERSWTGLPAHSKAAEQLHQPPPDRTTPGSVRAEAWQPRLQSRHGARQLA